jgi:hypothetical protein
VIVPLLVKVQDVTGELTEIPLNSGFPVTELLLEKVAPELIVIDVLLAVKSIQPVKVAGLKIVREAPLLMTLQPWVVDVVMLAAQVWASAVPWTEMITAAAPANNRRRRERICLL